MTFGHVRLMTPVLASHHTNGTVSGTPLFVWSRCLKQGVTLIFGHVMPVLASHSTDGITSSTMAFVSSR